MFGEAMEGVADFRLNVYAPFNEVVTFRHFFYYLTMVYVLKMNILSQAGTMLYMERGRALPELKFANRIYGSRVIFTSGRSVNSCTERS
jgi:hypothetical protein